MIILFIALRSGGKNEVSNEATRFYVYESKLYNRHILNKIAEIYIAEMNGNFAKALLSLPFTVKLIRCPTGQQIRYSSSSIRFKSRKRGILSYMLKEIRPTMTLKLFSYLTH